jgi:beta-glucosidase
MSQEHERELKAKLAALTLEQKVRLLTGADFWSLHPEPAIGLRRMVLSDGPVGVRGERWDERDPSVNLPCPSALAATWDEARVERLGRLLAVEARRKGVQVLLAPTVNLHRSPYAGRHFECFSEDPLLTARIGAAYVRGVQAGGVGATVKHFVANDAETERHTVDVRVDERALRELYLAPFEAIVREAGAWAVMAAYNRVNGTAMTEHPLLREVLKAEWGFDGVVVSDWFATTSTVASARAGLDLVMPGPFGPWGDELLAAVRAGHVDEAVVDDKVLRLLRLAARVGALDAAAVRAEAVPWPDTAVAAELRAAAAAGFVLLRNESAGPMAGPGRNGRAVLPLDPGRLRRLAVLGPNAATPRTLGGGSAMVFPPYAVSPLDGLRAALEPAVEVTHVPGAWRTARVPPADPRLLRPPAGAPPAQEAAEGAVGGAAETGVELRFVAADGTVLHRERRSTAAFAWLGSFGDFPAERLAAIEVHARLLPDASGEWTVGCSGVGDFELTLGGTTRLTGRLDLPLGAEPIDATMRPPQRVVRVPLEAGQELPVTLRYGLTAASRLPAFQLNLERPHGSDEQELARAVALARDADAAVVVVGTSEEVESEGFDRDSLALPGRQDELVRAVAAANPHTVVVVNAGAPVLLPWAEAVPAILLAWFPGQEFGNALADVLLGTVEPGGRLPTTWPATPDGLPTTTPTAGHLDYAEGIFVGYRAPSGPAIRYPFGHGLGYTTWAYLNLEVSGHPALTPDGAPDPRGTVTARVTVRNTGPRPGREVVQVYAARPDSTIPRPPRWLAGFALARVGPGETTTVEIAVSARAFAHWDTATRRWRIEPGSFTLTAGPLTCVVPVEAASSSGTTTTSSTTD